MAARQPAASPSAQAQPEAKKSVEFSEPQRVPEIAKPEQITVQKPSEPTTSTPRTLKDSAAVPEGQQSDDLTNLLSTVFGVPFVRRVNEESSSPIPVPEKRAKTEEAAPSPPVLKETPTAPPVIERPPTPAPPDDLVPSGSKTESQEPEEVSEDFKRMVDKVFKDLEKAFGVPADEHEEGEQNVAEGKKSEPVAAASDPTPSQTEVPTQPPAPTTVESSDPAATSSAPTAPVSEAIVPDVKDQLMEEPIVDDHPLDSSSATTFEEEDDVPASAADLQSEKAQSAATLIQQRYRRHLARVQRLEKLESLKAKLEKLTSGFTFPEHLDFQDPDSGLTTPLLDPVDGASHDGDERVVPVPALAFTHNNAPYHAHAQALLSLLVSADAISSDGDQEVRKVRKEFVKEVEEQLAEMERKRSDVWKKQQAEKANDESKENVPATNSGDVDMDTKQTSEPTADQDESDTKMVSPPAEYVEPETPNAVEAQSALDTPVDAKMTDDTQAELIPSGHKTPVETILEKEVIGIDPDVLTAPESDFIEPESTTEKEATGMASGDKTSESKGESGDSNDAKETAVKTARPPKPQVEDVSDVDMAKSFTESSVASEAPQ